MGKTSTRGQKGQMSRSGSKSLPWFEGGQMPIQRRIPKRGFKNFTKVEFQVVNVANIAKLDSADVTPELMRERGLVKKADVKIKVLGTGDLARACTITADAFSKSAIEKIKKAGGNAVVRETVSKRKSKAE
jgi:large subunit ribosomal protein L15